jgi:peptide/nickel transport system substrate-binding protein
LNIPVIPQAYYEGKDKMTKDIPMGSGCFKVDGLTFSEQTKMTLSIFSKWWKKLPYIEKVEAIGYSNTEAILQAFENGELDCVPSSLKTTEIYEILEGVDEKNYLSHDYVFLAFNLKRGVMANSNFRKAIAYAVDRTDIINNVYLTKATGAEQPLFNDTSLSSASVTRYDHNIVEAQQKLKSLGYSDNDGDGYLDTSDGPLTV